MWLYNFIYISAYLAFWTFFGFGIRDGTYLAVYEQSHIRKQILGTQKIKPVKSGYNVYNMLDYKLKSIDPCIHLNNMLNCIDVSIQQ